MRNSKSEARNPKQTQITKIRNPKRFGHLRIRISNLFRYSIFDIRISKGVTLIEAIFTVAIIGAGLIGVMYIFSGSTQSALIADQTVVAGNLAREKMEQIMADRANKGYPATIGTNYSDGQLAGNYSIYSRNVAILEVDPNVITADDDFLNPLPGSGYARVTVTITWNNGNNTMKEETLIANY